MSQEMLGDNPFAECREMGGLRWGQSFWESKNASWPFATWRLTVNVLEVQVHAWPLFGDRFVFARTDLVALRPYAGFLSRGIKIDHVRSDYPPFIVFWSFTTSKVLADAGTFGYSILN